MKIITGFNPVEANILLQMCFSNLQNRDDYSIAPKIPVSIPQPEGWGLLETNMSPTIAEGFCLWRNEISKNQFALIFHGASLNITTLTSSENIRMRTAEITVADHNFLLGNSNQAKCNAQLLHLFQQLFPRLQETLSQLPKSIELYLSGHGIGAGLATLALSTLHQKQISTSPPERIKTYLFGSPKIGNSKFVNHLNQLSFNNSKIDSLAFNLQNVNDLICELPQTIGLHPKLQGSIKSFRQRLIHGLSQILYAGISGELTEPYAMFGTPVLLPALSANGKEELSQEHQHDLRHYFQLLSKHFPI